MTSLMLLVVGCADVNANNGGGGSDAQDLSIACTTNVDPQNIVLLDWELTVSPSTPVESGRPFTVTVDGTAVVGELTLDAGQDVAPNGVREINLVDLKATVHVRSGAVGEDVVLVPEPIPYECAIGREACDPANDLEGVPGVRGNSDCQPEGTANPCGRFVFAPTSTECGADGECARLGKINQCLAHGFCITGDLEMPLQEVTAEYTAGAELEALFGWDDQRTGATVQQGGPNDGTWILPPASYEEPAGPIATRGTLVGFPVAFECTMGVDSQGPLGVDSVESLSSPTPDSALIAIPIEAPP